MRIFCAKETKENSTTICAIASFVVELNSPGPFVMGSSAYPHTRAEHQSLVIMKSNSPGADAPYALFNPDLKYQMLVNVSQ